MMPSRDPDILVGGAVSPIALSAIRLCSRLPSGNNKEKKDVVLFSLRPPDLRDASRLPSLHGLHWL